MLFLSSLRFSVLLLLRPSLPPLALRSLLRSLLHLTSSFNRLEGCLDEFSDVDGRGYVAPKLCTFFLLFVCAFLSNGVEGGQGVRSWGSRWL